MIVFLLLLIIFLFVWKTVLNMALSTLGLILGIAVVIILYLIREKRNGG